MKICNKCNSGFPETNEFFTKSKDGLSSEGMIVCHTCDTPSRINPNHLFIGTNKDNTNDMIIKGRQNFGGFRTATDKLG